MLTRSNLAHKRRTGQATRPTRQVRTASHRACLSLWITLSWLCGETNSALAQPLTLTLEGWGQTYQPAALVNLEATSKVYPWLRMETQIWTGQSPLPAGSPGDVVVLAAVVQDPTGHLQARAGRFVLTTGAVRPIHMDGGSVRLQTPSGFSAEAFSGSPVVPRFASRSYDWLVGGRLAQRFGRWGALGASYVEQRDRGRSADREVGADAVLYPMARTDLSGRFSYDLLSAGMSEVSVTGSMGSIDRRAELFTTLRNASLILPATSLFSVLSDAPSLQSGMSGRIRVAPRLRLEGLAAYRGLDGAHGARLKLAARLWLDDEGASAIEGAITRDGVTGQRWTGARVLAYRDVVQAIRLTAELELVAPDEPAMRGRLWPWGRLSSRYAVNDAWHLSAGVEGSSSPQFVRLFQALLRVAYHVGAT